MLNQILAAIWDCGSLDVDFIVRELETFEVDFYVVYEHLSEYTGRPNANAIIAEIYYIALMQSDENFFNKWPEKYSIYTNYLDSHLYIENEEMCSAEDIRKAVDKLKKAEVYYQPDLTVEQWQSGVLASFEVYRTKERLREDFPDVEIVEMCGDDVEDPTYID